MEEKPNYYAILPASVRYDKRLRASEKLLYGEITALTQKTGECWASNSYFSELYGVTNQAISKWILDLRECGYIDISYTFNGKKVDKRIIKLISTYVDNDINKSINRYQQKFKDNNTRINITSNNNTFKQKLIPTWLGMEIEVNQASPEEIAELERVMK